MDLLLAISQKMFFRRSRAAYVARATPDVIAYGTLAREFGPNVDVGIYLRRCAARSDILLFFHVHCVLYPNRSQSKQRTETNLLKGMCR